MPGKPKCRTCDTREVENEGDECDRCAASRAAILKAVKDKKKREGNGKK